MFPLLEELTKLLTKGKDQVGLYNWLSGKMYLHCRRAGVQSLGQEDPLEEGRGPLPVFFPRRIHGQRSLSEGHGSWGHWGQTQHWSNWAHVHERTKLSKIWYIFKWEKITWLKEFQKSSREDKSANSFSG